MATAADDQPMYGTQVNVLETEAGREAASRGINLAGKQNSVWRANREPRPEMIKRENFGMAPTEYV